MAKPHYEPLILEDCVLMYPNFAGLPDQYNVAGDRNSCVAISDELAAQLASIGWNIRVEKKVDPDVIPRKYISFTVKIDSRFPPRLWLANPGRQPQLMTPDEYSLLDFSRFNSVSLKINHYVYSEKPQKISGFLEEGFFELMPNRLHDRYFNTNGQA